MLIRFGGGLEFWRRSAAWAALMLGLALCAMAQQPAEPPAAAIERIKNSLDQVEARLKDGTISAQILNDLRLIIVTARDELRARIEELEPRAAEIGAALKELGPAPPKDAAPEEPAVAAEREKIIQNFSQVDGALKQARLLLVRTDQLGERISERRRGLYTREIFERGASALDPFFWLEAAEAVPAEIGSFGRLLQFWAGDAVVVGAVRMTAAALLILLIAGTALGVTRWWLPRFGSGPGATTRLGRARAGLFVFLWLAARAPLAVIACILVLEAFALLPARVEDLTTGLVAAVVVAALGRGVARGLLAPGEAQRRLVEIDDHTADCFHDHLVWSSRALAAAIFLQTVHKTLFAPLVLTVATNALLALTIAALLLHLVRCLRRGEIAGDAEVLARVPGIRLAAWILVVGILIALVGGYAALAAFVALRTVMAVVVIGALYLLLAATDAVFIEALAPDTQRARSLAANLGVKPRSVGLLGALLSAVVRVVLIVLAFILIIGPWEVSTADLTESLQRIPLGFRLGEINVSFRAILIALAVLAIVSVITRAAQRWLQRELLPRTTIEPSLQLSISTIFGYVGAIFAVSLALGSLGIDLQKIAFVASALAVGIGFGLQSIVSNFVSGLILLAERPIRVGDAIVVKGEEGWVRRIRVRATEIETYERATVIIPNSELITGMVKNWTHANTMGRIIIKIGVGYDSDPERVCGLLSAIANEHPHIVQNPAPGAFFVAFADSALEFELRCVVGNVANGLSAKSDLNTTILKRFREAGVQIPFPQREVHLRTGGVREDQPAVSAPEASRAASA